MNPAQISHLVSLSPDVPPPTFPVKVPFVKMDRCNKIVKKNTAKLYGDALVYNTVFID